MYPIVLDTSRLRIIVIGSGRLAEKRIQQLKDAGATDITTFDRLPSQADIKRADIIFAVGFDEATSQIIAALAKEAGKLVNVEDKKNLCDFHIPAMVQRGDLLLTVSTGGKSPALARNIRKKLEAIFGIEWKERLEFIAKKRQTWQKAGLSFDEVKQRSDTLIEEEGW